MDESEKRKQRLQAMRMAAAAQTKPAENQNLSGASSHQLLNPLADPAFSNADKSPSTPRFDFYTDPMSAFSGNKKRGSATGNNNMPNKLPSPGYDASRGLIPSPCSGQRNANMTPFPVPANQYQVNHSTQHGGFGTQSPVCHPASQFNQAAGSATPHHGRFGTHSPVPHPAPQFNLANCHATPNYGGFGTQSPVPHPNSQFNPAAGSATSHHGGFGTHSPISRPTSQFNQAAGSATPPSHSYGYSSMSGNNRPSNLTASPGYQSPSSGSRGGYAGSGSHSGSSWSAGRGNRGRGYNSRFGNSPGRSGWNSSGRKGPRETSSASNNPDMYYNRQMLEDPWDQLTPVVGSLLSPLKVEKASPSLKSWLPDSLVNREPRVQSQTAKFRSQPSRSSLAEYLAQSFEEAANDADEA